jgi:rRNA biogenesis protein RRP5
LKLSDPSGLSPSEVLRSLKVGDQVRALVLNVNAETKKIAFSLRPSHFFDEDLEDDKMIEANDEIGDEIKATEDMRLGPLSDQEQGTSESDDDSQDDEVST